jgi:hypothetical protein
MNSARQSEPLICSILLLMLSAYMLSKKMKFTHCSKIMLGFTVMVDNYGSVLGPHWHFWLPFYRLKCKFYRLKCKIYRLKCEFYRLKCKIYRLKCKFYRLKGLLTTMVSLSCQLLELFRRLLLQLWSFKGVIETMWEPRFRYVKFWKLANQKLRLTLVAILFHQIEPKIDRL